MSGDNSGHGKVFRGSQGMCGPDRDLESATVGGRRCIARRSAPVGVRKMAGGKGEWRIRVGTWRVVYRVDDGALVVLVVRVAPRGGVYR